ncbi:flagellar basal-body rod modification protein FlgD [Homoserinimonas aerilata]|uniref:Flagellar basal-body rod modification protein FlgD n=1 Tax=Homoserinimonas aerilata TaxID=1162970 RepID=A0A542YEV4_9MICO|nr:flagellar hook capping FlgD N-terminal domain-containing protein [Homoserinimonas aerilata]TQL46617.1 flagellar basal-body rod modification protein FlgD [Homoserinimonas aerilata]
MTIAGVDGVGTSTGIHTGTTLERTPKQTMDSEVFLSLLVTQLRNQDPSSPMDSNAMISQSAQLASMEQMTKLTTLNEENFSLQMRIAAAALIGQQVSYDTAEGETVTGVAESVSFSGPIPTVSVDGKDIALDVISGIKRITE